MYQDNDTIAAIATPIGTGGIAVIRISGDDAIAIADKCFRGKHPLASVESHTAHFGSFVNSGNEEIDQVVATIFKGPHSFTGEDVVEIGCHGGMFVTKTILESILSAGARAATPGEFTKHAFLNGRMDLAQAEATADLIHSSSNRAARSSISQLAGMLSNKINELRESLLTACSLLELELDFSEEGLEFINKSNIINNIESVIADLKTLLSSYSIGKIYREGIKVVIAGKPNVGKSSLMNALLNSDRAIVTDIPGTTRDVIEENITIDGILVRLVDTAGIRQSDNLVETEGIRRTNDQIADADIILFVLDPSQGFTQEDVKILSSMSQNLNGHSPTLIVAQNKSDLLNCRVKDFPPELVNLPIQKISAKTGIGLDQLRSSLSQKAAQELENVSDSSLILTNSRHKQSIEKTISSLEISLNSLNSSLSNDLISIDIRAGLNALGEIVGVITSEDVLNNIFSKFCIGK
ncbi:MAG TPA: tRNA uridine-5-carboxymethylaminomethyl(34) synthesis GTPase MnmE [Bacteroidota bacterium]|nr:tRNA uridine-5-carboxymethylaminomethyl(34) synthesis GTPase MnmE [Bacteroidota bacterium]